MKPIYLDNAATTALDERVLEAMLPFMKGSYGNPNATHQFGRKPRSAVERARKQIADRLNVSPLEIYFTSGGTEADNIAIQGSVTGLGVKRIISSELEHHAVLETVEQLEKRGHIRFDRVRCREDGHIDLQHLEELLAETDTPTLVSLMHGNNEIGNLLPIKKVGELCRKYGAWFHSDTVQTLTHYPLDLDALPVDMVACSGHKFHGPKGIGFLYFDKKLTINPLIHGGGQERNMRGGTENVYGIVGLGEAFELGCSEMEENHRYIQGLKDHMIRQLEERIPGVEFNGDAKGSSLYTVLNVRLPRMEEGDMLLFHLDIEGIAASGGSACSSGANEGSHVLNAMGVDTERPSVRFSFSKNNTREELDRTVEKLGELVGVPEVKNS